jgi:hypothetical protein
VIFLPAEAFFPRSPSQLPVLETYCLSTDVDSLFFCRYSACHALSSLQFSPAWCPLGRCDTSKNNFSEKYEARRMESPDMKRWGMMRTLTGAMMIILITGATAGFGESMTRRFIANGHKVIATGRREERLKTLQDELGDNLYTAQLDVRNRARLKR